VIKLPKGATKINITQRKASIRVSRKRTIILPSKDAYKTDTIRDNILNHYNGSKKDLTGLGLIIND